MCSERSLCSQKLIVSSVRFEFEADGVDAVAFARGSRAVVEHVSQVASARAAEHFHPGHAVRPVGFRHDFVLVRLVEAGSARSCIELVAGFEKNCPATRAGIVPFFFVVLKLSGKRHLGSFFAQHVVLFGGELFFPLVFVLGHVIFLYCHENHPYDRDLRLRYVF